VKEKSVLSTKRLTLAECAVVISIAILSKAGTPTTPKEIADYLKEDVQTVRNILERLRNKGLVLSSLAFGLGGFASISSSSQVRGRERIYRLVDDVKNILDKYPEILKWTKVNLGIEDEKKLMEFINKRAEELRLVLSASSARGVPYDQTPLHTAAFRGDVEDVKLRLESGADPNAKDNAGRTPLHLAAFRGHVEVVKLLLERGADPNAKNDAGWTPLHIAVQEGHVEVVKLLLESGADPNAKNDAGWTPLHKATNEGHVEVVKLLLESGADPNAKDNAGWTPLHDAAHGGHVEVVKLLLERGADPNAKDNAGRTPLHLAAQGGHVEVVKLLLERGADPWIADNDGRIPLDYAYDSTIHSLLKSAMRK
jgi:ankyrin repeat protein